MSPVAETGVGPVAIKGWSLYDQRMQYGAITGRFAVARVVNRFHARYRFARSFKRIELHNFSDATIEGYSALMRAALHWSAFELFKQALKIDDTRHLAESYPFEGHLARIRECFLSEAFFRVIKEHLADKKQRQQVDAFVKGEPISPLVLAKAMRHIFLHGSLTPNSGGIHPTAVAAICDELCAYMDQIMNSEFEQRAIELANHLG